MPQSGPPLLPPSVGREEFALHSAGRGCSAVQYQGTTHCHVRNEVTIATAQPFLMVRALFAGRDEFSFKGVGAVTESPESLSLFLHGDPENACVSEHAAHARIALSAVMVAAERLRALCDGMAVPRRLGDLTAGLGRNSMATLKMSARKRRLLGELGSNPYSGDLSRLYREGKVLELLADIFADLTDTDPGSPRLCESEGARIEAVCQRLLADLAALPSQEILAQEVGLSPRRLSVAFRQVTGVTMTQWIVDKKLALAAELLLEGELAVKEIAFRLGYAQVSTFTAAFSRRFGCPPASYRKSLVSHHAVHF